MTDYKLVPEAWVTRLYNTAYHAGHHDTVEGCYTHVCSQDMDSYHEDIVQEWLADNPQPTIMQGGPINVIYTDGVGAGRRSPADCRDGVSYVTVGDTVYWPLSADDAQRLHSAECGRGEFSGPASSAPDTDVLAEALERFVEWYEQVSLRNEPRFQFYDKAKKALAAYRKGGGV